MNDLKKKNEEITVGLNNFWMYLKSIYTIGRRWIIKYVPRPLAPPHPCPL